MANAEIVAIRAMFDGPRPELTTAEFRAFYDSMGTNFPLAPDVTASSVEANGVPAEWTATPEGAEDRAILYLHGGGYVIGSILSHRHVASELGRSAGARTLAIHYRLAPEAPFPAAVNDAVSAYRYLLKEGFKPGSIAIAGDSAGGGLTVATMLAIKADGLPQPSCGVCISPWVDLEMVGGSMLSKEKEDPMVQKPQLTAWALDYLGQTSAKSPLASPLHGDLRGIAPLLIQVGSAETLMDDAVRLAGVAGAVEVPVRLEIWPEMLHVWHFFHPVLEDGRKALKSAGSFISEHMTPA